MTPKFYRKQKEWHRLPSMLALVVVLQKSAEPNQGTSTRHQHLVHDLRCFR